MSKRTINIAAGAIEVAAELNDTPTADLVWEALPISAPGSTWGDEIYFGLRLAPRKMTPFPP